MKVLCVFGTRPEAIKMAPVIHQLKARASSITTKVCVTAQHREMLDQVLTLFDIRPDYDLDLMEENQSLTEVTYRVLSGLEPIIIQERPDWILVQGDTTTVMATSLAAYYHRVCIAHIEAGLRTYNKYQPYPEEINRVIVDRLADLLFAPTEWARQNLLREGAGDEHIRVTGNTIVDALLAVADYPYDLGNSPLSGIPWSRRVILVTAHRRESFGQPMRNICSAILEIAHRYQDDVHVVYPVHWNPNIRNMVYDLLGMMPNITLLEPLDYLSFVNIMKRSFLILTDSGGIQEEAPSLGKPTLVLRGVTERPEAVKAGVVRLVGTDPSRIIANVIALLENPDQYARMAHTANPFGDGKASQRIVAALLEGTSCVS